MASTAIGREASRVSRRETAERAPIASTAVASRPPVTQSLSDLEPSSPRRCANHTFRVVNRRPTEALGPPCRGLPETSLS
jgi:hypothetical protein